VKLTNSVVPRIVHWVRNIVPERFILVLALANGLLYLVLVPPWQHYDEPTHFEYAWLRLWCINRPLLGANGETSPILDFQPGYEFPGVLSQVTA